MKRTLSGILLFGLLASSVPNAFSQEAAAASQKYEDARSVLTDLADLIEAFVESMGLADRPEDVAKVLDSFAESMKGLVPKINETRKKYPELKTEDTHPEELKPLLERVNKDFQGMMKAYGKVKEHGHDSAVQKADANYKEVMSGLR